MKIVIVIVVAVVAVIGITVAILANFDPPAPAGHVEKVISADKLPR